MPGPEPDRVVDASGRPLGQQVERLAAVMATTRRQCPWDVEQTHRSLVKYLIEETGEVVDAIESGDDDDLAEELGDLLLQVVFHAEIARQEGRFTLDDVADRIADKLIHRHPYIFAGEQLPTDLRGSWERAKRADKQRSSALEGIPVAMSSLARAAKVISRSSDLGVLAQPVADELIDADQAGEPIDADQAGAEILAIVRRCQACGVDPDQATRDALRQLEARIRALESER